MKKRSLVVILTSIMMVVLTACGGDNADDQAIAFAVAATQTKQAWEASLDEARQIEQTQAPADTPEPVIEHVMFPGEPTEKSNAFLTDFNSIDYADEGHTYSDQFIINRFERPFTVKMEEYRGYLDLVLANLKINPPWIYLDVFLAVELPESSAAMYSLELDVDLDGRGDYWIRAAMPADSNWTVDGVFVFEDSNDDVGGPNPVITDPPEDSESTNGYDLLLFQEGLGDDPDLAWVRRNPEDPTSLQIALKQSLIGSQGILWAVWADEGLRNPGLADYNDRFTFDQAGSPYPNHMYHPIQAINLVDSTCRSYYGFEPTGAELGLCQIYRTGTGWKFCVRLPDGESVCVDTCGGCPDVDLLNEIYGSRGYHFYCEKCDMPPVLVNP